jgi:hypothetical protein
MPPPRSWLVVVRRDERGLYEHLRRSFQGLTFIDVVLDRRQRDGIGAPSPSPRDDRRQSLTAAERERWTLLGYRLVPRGGPS